MKSRKEANRLRLTIYCRDLKERGRIVSAARKAGRTVSGWLRWLAQREVER